MLVADLGCGSGELTLELHQKLAARETLGIDSSAAMLAKAPQAPGLRFEQGDLAEFAPVRKFDLIFSNAALHWGGQLAVQVPMNDDHVSHRTAYELARAPEFRRLLGGFERRPALLEPARYAEWLHHLGCARQHVRLQVYGHLLDDREQVIEWVRGTLLTDYQKLLPAADWERFLERYRQLLIPQLADDKPFFYTYPRLLMWGAKI